MRQALETCRHEHLIGAMPSSPKSEAPRARGAVASSSPRVPDSTMTPQVHVPLPDLRAFNRLLVEPLNPEDSCEVAFIPVPARDALPESQTTVLFA